MLLQRLSRFAREPRVPALVSCWPTRWPHSHSVPSCGTLIPRWSVSPLSVTTTKLSSCVDQRAGTLQMSSVLFSCNLLRQNQRVHRSSRCSLRSAAGELPNGTWCVEQVSSDTFQTSEVSTCCFPDCTTALLASECNDKSVRCHLCQS